MSPLLTAPAPSPSGSPAPVPGLHLPHLSSGQWLLIGVLVVAWLLVEQVRLSAIRRREQRLLDRQEYQRALAQRRAERRLDAEEHTRRRGAPGRPVRSSSRQTVRRVLAWLWSWMFGRNGRRGWGRR